MEVATTKFITRTVVGVQSAPRRLVANSAPTPGAASSSSASTPPVAGGSQLVDAAQTEAEGLARERQVPKCRVQAANKEAERIIPTKLNICKQGATHRCNA